MFYFDYLKLFLEWSVLPSEYSLRGWERSATHVLQRYEWIVLESSGIVSLTLSLLSPSPPPSGKDMGKKKERESRKEGKEGIFPVKSLTPFTPLSSHQLFLKEMREKGEKEEREKQRQENRERRINTFFSLLFTGQKHRWGSKRYSRKGRHTHNVQWKNRLRGCSARKIVLQ